MGEVINFPQSGSAKTTLSTVDEKLSCDDIARLEAIRDNVESLLDMVAGIRRDPEAVAYAAARFGIMRMFHCMVVQQRWVLLTAASKQPKSRRILASPNPAPNQC